MTIRPAEKEAYTLDEFCEVWAVSRTRAYEEIRRGELRAVKQGRRTIILAADARDRAAKLPALTTSD